MLEGRGRRGVAVGGRGGVAARRLAADALGFELQMDFSPAGLRKVEVVIGFERWRGEISPSHSAHGYFPSLGFPSSERFITIFPDWLISVMNMHLASLC